MPIDLLHLAYTHFPADTRVKREAAALRDTGRRLAVIALRGPGERAVERGFVWRCRRLVAGHRALARVQVVHVHTLPDFLLWAALPARHRGARLVFDMHEVFPEFTAAKFPGASGRLLAGLARRIERWARRRADVTITVNRLIAERLAGSPIGRLERRLILHNTADPADFGEPPPLPGAGAPGRLELIYHGTLSALYGLDVAIRGIAQVRGLGLPARLTILGDGPELDRLRALVAELGLEDAVSFEGRLPQAALPARLLRCTAGVVPTRLDGMTRYSLSMKLLEYVHLGLPVLAARPGTRPI
ncbi:MAG: hypothetical protein DMD41_03265 [Gemmatimonadetes bacterium]|nr:MAG: hypothetical protein DMD41_03265 [Gemmatimonadota bacterium]